MIVKARKRLNIASILIHLFFISLVIICIYPVLLVIGVSLSDENSILDHGFQVIPKVFSFSAYAYIFKSSETIVNAYLVTIITTVAGTILSVLTITLFAYALSRKEFYFRKFFTFFIFFTMIFNGGMVPWYIVCVRVLKINNTILALILPYIISGWYVMIMRTFFSTTIPDSVVESARIDGAGEFKIFFRIVLPLALPGVATIALFSTLGYWNDWWLPLMLIKNAKLYNLQYLIYQILNNMDFLNQLAERGQNVQSLPTEPVRMAICVISIGPIIFAYPFFQKYFIQGLTIGAIKG